MIVSLNKAYPSRYGAPVVNRVDTGIFVMTYYGDCMGCTFCHDVCCSHGADVTAVDVDHMEGHADKLERHVGRPRDQWFTEEYNTASDWPGGRATATQTADGKCVFLNRSGRGCLIHQLALQQDIDVHEIKPMVCLLFPVTWAEDTLLPSDEICDRDLICVGPGQTCYRSSRADLGYYFGADLLAELDALEKVALEKAAEAGPVRLPLV